MIFAAGKGRRLGERGLSTPKALLELNGHPLLYHILLKLKKSNINHVVLNLMHLGGQIKDYIESLNLGMDINYSYEEELLETGGGLKKAANFFKNSEQVIVHNSDIYSEIDVNKLINENQVGKRDVTLAVQDRESSRKLLFSKDNKLCGWKNFKTGEVISMNSEQVTRELAFSGIQCVSNSLIKQISNYPKDKFSVIEFYLSLPEKQNRVFALDCSTSVWFDLGTEEKLSLAKAHFNKV